MEKRNYKEMSNSELKLQIESLRNIFESKKNMLRNICEEMGEVEKEYLDAIDDFAGEKLDIIHLYGTKGIGEVAKYAYVGQAVATPNDVGGADEILEMSATIIPNTAAVKVTDSLTVTDNKDGTFTVASAGA